MARSRKSSRVQSPSSLPLHFPWAEALVLMVHDGSQSSNHHKHGLDMEGMEKKKNKECERFPGDAICHLLSSRWLEVNHTTTDSYMGFWEIFLLESLELNIIVSVVREEGRKGIGGQ